METVVWVLAAGLLSVAWYVVLVMGLVLLDWLGRAWNYLTEDMDDE